MEPTDEIAIRLSLNEWNQVLLVLAEQPFRTVAPLIKKISDQAQAAAAPPALGPRAVAAD